jgi:hypothetical protein
MRLPVFSWIQGTAVFDDVPPLKKFFHSSEARATFPGFHSKQAAETWCEKYFGPDQLDNGYSAKTEIEGEYHHGMCNQRFFSFFFLILFLIYFSIMCNQRNRHDISMRRHQDSRFASETRRGVSRIAYRIAGASGSTIPPTTGRRMRIQSHRCHQNISAERSSLI